MRVAILTISDAGARGERADASGDAIAAWVGERGYALAARALVPDDSVAIVRQLLGWCDGDAADLVLTTGGTGLVAARQHAGGDARRARARGRRDRRAAARGVHRLVSARGAVARRRRRRATAR